LIGPTPERRQVLRRSALFARLPDDEIDAILEHAAIRRYVANTQIFYKGDPGSCGCWADAFVDDHAETRRARQHHAHCR